MDDRVCEYCNGPIEQRKVMVQYHYQRRLILIEHVPAGVCQHCGERYYDDRVVMERQKPVRVIQTPVFKFVA